MLWAHINRFGRSLGQQHPAPACPNPCAARPVVPSTQIGAVNTLVRQEDGSLKGYNTDWSAAIAAIERGLDPGGWVPRGHARHANVRTLPLLPFQQLHFRAIVAG